MTENWRTPTTTDKGNVEEKKKTTQNHTYGGRTDTFLKVILPRHGRTMYSKD